MARREREEVLRWNKEMLGELTESTIRAVKERGRGGKVARESRSKIADRRADWAPSAREEKKGQILKSCPMVRENAAATAPARFLWRPNKRLSSSQRRACL